MDDEFVYKRSARFIKLLQKYPCLYDVNHKGYNISALQNEMWQELSRRFGDLPPKECKKKWEDFITRYGEYYIRLECQKMYNHLFLGKKELKKDQLNLIDDMRYFKPHIRLSEAKENLLKNPEYTTKERQVIMDFEFRSRSSPDTEKPRVSNPDSERLPKKKESNKVPQNFPVQPSQPAFQLVDPQQVFPMHQPAFQRPNFEPAFEIPNPLPVFPMQNPHPVYQMPNPQQFYGVQAYHSAVPDPSMCLPSSEPLYSQPVFETQLAIPTFQSTSYQPPQPPFQPNFPPSNATYSTASGTQSKAKRHKEYLNEKYRNLIVIGQRKSVLDVKEEHEKSIDLFFNELSQQIVKSGMSQEKFKEIQTIIVEIVAAKLPEYNQ
ncbi:uncharacterized protein LOC129809989 isoform X1 [Phlebotomus papatasi]|uniref:uncharacterized protein LOC129809989 isoform X1 n=1 Tax=Phlebotomus papatasi TaxID=29031 RepID=UPI00248369C7|nr:uncharacterized protein LOC129809989 isoform X1 [Phlebotomus papatasi]